MSGPGSSEGLERAEVEALRRAIGSPAPERMPRAMEEVERQVALEDLVIIMVDGVTATVRAFFDLIVQLTSTDRAAPGSGGRDGEET